MKMQILIFYKKGDCMKKHLIKGYALLVSAALIFCLVQINDLKNDIHNLTNSINRISQQVENDMNSIYQNVQNMLEEEENQLSEASWKLTEIDTEHRTAVLECTIIPKEYYLNSTVVKLIGENEVILDYADGKFHAEIEIPLFETTQFEQIVLSQNDEIHTQKLDWSIDPKTEALIHPNVSCYGKGRGIYGKSEYTWKTESTINIHIEHQKEFEIQGIDIVEVLDGKEIHRTSVDLSREGQRGYAEQISKTGEAVPEYLFNDHPEEIKAYQGSVHFFYPFHKEIKVPNGSEYICFVEITDEHHFIYRCVAESIAILPNGDYNEDRADQLRMLSFGEPIQILDEQRNEIYTSELMEIYQ